MKWDHLFEWYLAQQIAKQMAVKIQRSRSVRRIHEIQKTDISSLHLSYNLRGQLSLADVKPTGFFVRSRA